MSNPDPSLLCDFMTKVEDVYLRTLVDAAPINETLLIRIEQESVTRQSDPDVILITKADLEGILKKMALQ